MSYILDALRRADAERGRGHVPGLNAQPVPAGETPKAATRPAVPWLAAAAVALAGGAIGWFFFGRAPEAAPPVPSAAVQPSPMPAAPPPVQTAPPSPVAMAPAPTPLPLAPMPAPPPPAPPAPMAAPAPVQTETPQSTPAPARAAARNSAPTPAAAASALPPPVPFAELPDEVKRQLPMLAMGGAIWSEQPSARMLIVSGQLVREGDPVAPNVKLEQIKPRSAVLNWKGLRYEVPY